jgi:hypothetical protein
VSGSALIFIEPQGGVSREAHSHTHKGVVRKRLYFAAVIAVAMICAPSALARQRPMAVPHGLTPFGYYHESVCANVPGEAHCFAMVVTNSARTAVVRNTPGGYGPVDLQTAYGLSSLSATGGGGQTVAVVDAYDDPTAESDLATYRSTYGLSACTTANGCFRKVDQRGGMSYPVSDAGWSEEISLDLDMVSAVAPNAHILLVEGDGTSFHNLGTAVDEAAVLGATQISNSYGGDEVYGASFAGYYSHPGIAITASTGDDGYGCSGSWQPCFPASAPIVEAVGGTSLTSVSPRTESAWGGAGSGCSDQFAKPIWQQDRDCSTRSTADVSADADPATGVAVYYSGLGGWAIFGGTSASSPMIAAVDALIGLLAASPQWAYQHPSAFNDVTAGTNNAPESGCSDYECNAGSGYDGPTGLGTPNGAAMTPLPATPTITSTPINPTTSTNASFSFTDSTSGVAFMCALDGPAYQACSSPQGYTGLPGGAHVFKVEATSSAGTSTPAEYHWTISQTPPAPPAAADPPAPPVTAPPAPKLTAHPGTTTTSRSVSFRFTDRRRGVRFQCSSGSGRFSACSSPKRYSKLTNGKHTFHVRAVDSHGTSKVTSFTWKIRAAP